MSLIHALAMPAKAMRRRFLAARGALTPPSFAGMRLTPRRLLNFYLVQWEQARGRTRVHGYPLGLTIEATNACNLRCPYCFTGAGEVGREKTMLQMPLYDRMLDELGSRLLRMEFYNWGEPLLNKQIYEMIAKASARGIGTTISTNFSIPFDEERAEKLVRSGLAVLGVSLDGATQESYEQYRRRGDLALALENCRLVADAKRRLGSATPELVWEFHIFPHNRHEIEAARTLADEIGMTFAASKGWVAGPDWDTDHEFDEPQHGGAERCFFLWRRAVVNTDGGVAPCCAVYYPEDDYGSVVKGRAATARGEPAVDLGDLQYRSFREVWNGDAFVASRQMFRNRDATPGADRKLVCFDCPVTVMYDDWGKHRGAGGTATTFVSRYGANDGFNYYFDRRPERVRPLAPAETDVIGLTEISAPDRAG